MSIRVGTPGILKGLALVAAVVAGAMFIERPSEALPSSEVETYFYATSMPASEWTFSNHVGWKFLGCDGYRVVQGTQTTNRVVISFPCPGSSLTSSSCFLNGVQVSCRLVERMVDSLPNPEV